MESYSKPIQEQILDAAFAIDTECLNKILKKTTDKTLPELDLNLVTAVSCLTSKGDVENAKKIIDKVDLTALSNRDHYEMLWGIANNRGSGGAEDPAFLVIKHMLKAGFKAGVIHKTEYGDEKTDLFDQIVKQSQFGSANHSTDLVIIEAILETGSVAGFPKSSPINAQTIEGLRNNTIEIRSFRDRPALQETVRPSSSVEQAELVIAKHNNSYCIIL
jgi:hypothetical protein